MVLPQRITNVEVQCCVVALILRSCNKNITYRNITDRGNPLKNVDPFTPWLSPCQVSVWVFPHIIVVWTHDIPQDLVSRSCGIRCYNYPLALSSRSLSLICDTSTPIFHGFKITRFLVVKRFYVECRVALTVPVNKINKQKATTNPTNHVPWS